MPAPLNRCLRPRPPASHAHANAPAPQPSGMAVMTGRMKKSDGKWDDRKQREFLRKWNESCWKCVVYVFFTGFAFLVRPRPPGL